VMRRISVFNLNLLDENFLTSSAPEGGGRRDFRLRVSFFERNIAHRVRLGRGVLLACEVW
jgi:hypothetical protein